MLFKLGLFLILVAAACGQGNRNRPSYRKESPKVLPKSTIPPPTTEITTAVPVKKSTPKLVGKSVVGYQPLYDSNNADSEVYAPILPPNWSFKCPKPYGYFKYEGRGSCDIYIECRHYQASLRVCPDGMHFKKYARWSEYPCAYPPEAECLGRDDELPPRPTAECPRQYGNFPFTGVALSRYDQCSKYISCASGIAHVMNCTFGLVFNPVLRQCDWPEKVPGCQDAFEFRCPVPHLGEEDRVFNYRYPNDPECRHFYSCLNGGYRVLACDEGLRFDHRIGRCVDYEDFFCDYVEPPFVGIPRLEEQS